MLPLSSVVHLTIHKRSSPSLVFLKLKYSAFAFLKETLAISVESRAVYVSGDRQRQRKSVCLLLHYCALLLPVPRGSQARQELSGSLLRAAVSSPPQAMWLICALGANLRKCAEKREDAVSFPHYPQLINLFYWVACSLFSWHTAQPSFFRSFCWLEWLIPILVKGGLFLHGLLSSIQLSYAICILLIFWTF